MPGVFGLHTCYRTLFRQPDTNRQCPLRTVCRLGGDENTNDTLRRKYLYAFDPRLHCLQGVSVFLTSALTLLRLTSSSTPFRFDVCFRPVQLRCLCGNRCSPRSVTVFAVSFRHRRRALAGPLQRVKGEEMNQGGKHCK